MKHATLALIPALSIKQFLLRGMAGCLIGAFIGMLNVALLGNPYRAPFQISRPLYHIIVFGFGGVIAGAIQGGFLRPVTRPPSVWLLLSGLSWSLIGLLIDQIPFWMSSNDILLGLLYGGIVGVPQWLLLQRSLRFAAFWLLLSPASWIMLFVLLELFF
jgi:hypothetical protein